MATRDMTDREFRAALKRNGLKPVSMSILGLYIERADRRPEQQDVKIPAVYFRAAGKGHHYTLHRRFTVSESIKRFREIAAEEAGKARAKAEAL